MFYHAFRSRCMAFFRRACYGACRDVSTRRNCARRFTGDRNNKPDGYGLVLSENSVQSINTELRALQRKGLDTYIVVVPDFSGTAPLEWCNTVGTQSGLSSSSLVLVIATQERQTATCGNSNGKGIDDATVVSAFSGLREVLSKADPLDEST